MEVTCDVRGRAVSLKCKKEIGLRRPLEVNSRSSLMFFVFYKKNRWDCTGNMRGTNKLSWEMKLRDTSKPEIIGIGFV